MTALPSGAVVPPSFSVGEEFALAVGQATWRTRRARRDSSEWAWRPTGHWPPHLKSSGADLKHVSEPVDVEEARVLDTDPKAPEVCEEGQEPDR